MACTPGTSSVCLVYRLIWFVLFIWLIWFIWLVSSNKKPDKLDRPDKPNNGLLVLADFFSILLVLLLCRAEAGIIPSMRHTWTLIGLLAGLCLIGATTTQLIPASTEAGRIGWMLYLIEIGRAHV